MLHVTCLKKKKVYKNNGNHFTSTAKFLCLTKTKQNKTPGFMKRCEEEKALSHIITRHINQHSFREFGHVYQNRKCSNLDPVTTQLGNHPTNVFLKHFNGKKINSDNPNGAGQMNGSKHTEYYRAL